MSNYNSRNLNVIASLKRFTPNIIITAVHIGTIVLKVINNQSYRLS